MRVPRVWQIALSICLVLVSTGFANNSSSDSQLAQLSLRASAGSFQKPTPDSRSSNADLVEKLESVHRILASQNIQANLTPEQKFTIQVSSYSVLLLREKTDDAHQALLAAADLNTKVVNEGRRARNKFELSILAKLDPQRDRLDEEFKTKFLKSSPTWNVAEDQLRSGSIDWALSQVAQFVSELEDPNGTLSLGNAISNFTTLHQRLVEMTRQEPQPEVNTQLEFLATSSVVLLYERFLLRANQSALEFKRDVNPEPFSNLLDPFRQAFVAFTPFARRQFLEDIIHTIDNVIALDDPMGAVALIRRLQEIGSAYPSALEPFQNRLRQYQLQLPRLKLLRLSHERLIAGQVMPASVLLMDEEAKIRAIQDEVAREEVLGLFYRSRARIAMTSGDLKSVQADYQSSISLLTKHNRLSALGAWGELAQVRAAAGEYKQALADVESGFALSSKLRQTYSEVFVHHHEATLHVTAVIVHYLSGDDAKLKASLDRAVPIYEGQRNAVCANPMTLAMLYSYRGMLLAKKEYDCFLALMNFKDALSAMGKDPQTHLAEIIHLEIGKCEVKKKDPIKALASFKKALLINRNLRLAARSSVAYDRLLGVSAFEEIQKQFHSVLYELMEKRNFTSTLLAQELFLFTELTKSRATVDEIESMRRGVAVINPATSEEDLNLLKKILGSVLPLSDEGPAPVTDAFAQEQEFLCEMSKRHQLKAVMVQYVPIESRDRVVLFVSDQTTTTWVLLDTPWSRIAGDVTVLRNAIKESLMQYAELRKSPRPDPEVVEQIKGLENEIDKTSAILARMLFPREVPAIGNFIKYLEGKSLILVPYGGLHNLPFVALPMSETGAGQSRYLIDVVGRLTTVPSRTVLHSVVSLYKSNLEQPVDGVLLVGDPQSADLPAVQGEFDAIKQAVGRADSISHLKDLTPAVRRSPAVHFALHAFFNRANLGRSGLSLQDGIWTLQEITRVNTRRTRLITMGACESGEAGLLPGDEVWGLANGFMFAGVPAVVGSLWDQDDEASRIFFSTFYARMRNRTDVGAAFRTAMLAVRQPTAEAGVITEVPGLKGSANPCFWAGFNFIGE